MSLILSKFNDRTVITLEIDAASSLSSELVTQINNVCDSVDDVGHESILVIKLIGSLSPLVSRSHIDNVDIQLVTKWEKTLRRLERSAGVTIAVAEKYCGLLGLEVLLTTDYRIAEKNSHIYTAGTQGQSWPGMSLHRLVNQVGITQARRIALFGLQINVDQAIELNLFDEAVDDTLLALAMFFRSLSSINTGDIAVRRQLILDASATSFEDALGTHLAACDRVLRYEHSLDANQTK